MKASIALLAGLGVPSGPPPLTFDVPPGSYTVDNTLRSEFTITASQPVVWTWSASGGTPSISPGSGGTSNVFDAQQNTTNGGGIRHTFITVHSSGNTWTIDLTAEDPSLQ